MGKVVLFKSANFAANCIEQLDITVADPVVQIDVTGLVTIQSEFDVYYTTDGTTPTTSSTLYSVPFSVVLNTTVKAIAVAGGNSSNVVSSLYDGTVPAPTISVSGGVATITSSYPCYYTLDGTTPDNTSTSYTAPFAVSDGDVIKAVAYTNSTYSQVTSVTVVMMAFNKRLLRDGTLETAEGYCVSPYFVVGSKGNSVTWAWNNGDNLNGNYFCEFSSAKANLGDGWQGQGTSSRTFNLYYTGVYYARATFVMGTAGSVVNNTSGETVFEYDGSTS